MPETTARIAAVLLASAFAWAAVAKFLAFPRWRSVVARYGMPTGAGAIVAPVVPVAEVAIAGTVLALSPRIGAAAAIAALSLFSLAILRARSINGDRLPCGCFGGAEERHYRTMLWRNALLGGLAAAVLLARHEPRLPSPSLPEGGEIAAALLVAGGVLLALWTATRALGALRRRELQ